MSGHLLAKFLRQSPSREFPGPESSAGPSRNSSMFIEERPELIAKFEAALKGAADCFDLVVANDSSLSRIMSQPPALILVNPLACDGGEPQFVRGLLAEAELFPVPIVLLIHTPDVASQYGLPGSVFDGCIEEPFHEDCGARLRSFIHAATKPAVRGSKQPAIPDLGDSCHGPHAIELLEHIERCLPESQFDLHATEALTQLARIADHVGHREAAFYLDRAATIAKGSTARSVYAFRSTVRFCLEMICDRSDLIPGLTGLRKGYIENRRSEITDLNKASRNGDFARLRAAGHDLKGSGGMYGCSELSDIGKSLELAARDADVAGIQNLLDRLSVSVGALRSESTG